jgi:DNA-binding ferritin-like protein
MSGLSLVSEQPSRSSQHSISMNRSTPISRSATGPDDDTAQPGLTSGFGAVMEEERNLQSSTEGYLAAVNGPHAIALDRILRNQQLRLDDNIGLLEERYEMLPHPARFQALRGRLFPLTNSRRVATPSESNDLLPNLVAQHLTLLANVATLIAHSSQGGQGQYILTEVARNHEEMAWMLTALLKEDQSVRERVSVPVTAAVATAPTPGTTEGNWENEGGAPRASPVRDLSAIQRVA